VYCPRCGTPNEAGDRYCSSCGAALCEIEPSQQGTSMRDRVGRAIGTSRRARWVSAITTLAVAVAIVSFIALDPDDEGIPRDAYTLAAERICLDAKRQIVAIGRGFRADADSASASAFARALLPAVSGWRLQLADLEVPLDREEEADRLVAALRKVEARIATLARDASASNPRRTLATAARADEASTAVEEAAASLGLDECARVKLGFIPEKD
jgi:zinc-ribbon domain